MATPIGIDIEIEGGEELLASIKAMGIDVQKILREAALRGARVIVDAANERAPGPHNASEVKKDSAERVEVDIGPDEDHWYYRFFETGAGRHEITGDPLAWGEGAEDVVTGRVLHPGMAARPFLRPAVDENEGKTADAVGQVLRGAIE
jgi:HK97 gp10 family phage protein